MYYFTSNEEKAYIFFMQGNYDMLTGDIYV